LSARLIAGRHFFCPNGPRGTLIAASLISILLNVFIVRGTFGWLKRKFPASAQGRIESTA
jgi:hypothetical protein